MCFTSTGRPNPMLARSVEDIPVGSTMLLLLLLLLPFCSPSALPPAPPPHTVLVKQDLTDYPKAVCNDGTRFFGRYILADFFCS